MGQQSLNIKNRLNILENSNKKLLKYADDLYLKEHFLLGNGVDDDKVKHENLIKYALCTDNCEIIDWVSNKLNGKLEDVEETLPIEQIKY